MPIANINEADLWYDVLGQGEPLLLHHGYTASRVNWMPVAERLKDRYQIILMECRGTGESQHTQSGYEIAQYALDVVGLLITSPWSAWPLLGTAWAAASAFNWACIIAIGSPN